jgi:hypothetical protein
MMLSAYVWGFPESTLVKNCAPTGEPFVLEVLSVFGMHRVGVIPTFGK